jgi:hypothetical protein
VVRTDPAPLARLERWKAVYGPEATAHTREALETLARTRLRNADEVLRLHEALCFLRAYPDDAGVLDLVVDMLEGFHERRDLRAARRELADTGVSGTDIDYVFYWTTACWLARRFPDSLHIIWSELETAEKLQNFLPLLLPFSETLLLDEGGDSLRGLLDSLKGPNETDATFLVHRFARLRGGEEERENAFESFQIPFRIRGGAGTPSRGSAHLPGAKPVFQSGPLDRSRPDMKKELGRPSVKEHAVSTRDARRILDLTHGAMVTRGRALDAFAYADPNDVCMIDCGEGLRTAWIGITPARRHMLEAMYGFLVIKNGVPVGYGSACVLFGSAEVAFNMFESFRAAGTAHVYGRLLASVRHLFGCDAFVVDPYQLGHENPDGLRSGAWWFYYKLGLRPRDPDVRKVVKRELARMKKNPGHRSDLRTLKYLASKSMVLHLGETRSDILGTVDLGKIGRRISGHLAEQFGAAREAGVKKLSQEAADLLGLKSLQDLTQGERRAWERWAPLITVLPKIESWSAKDRRALTKVVRAKGGRREMDFVRAFDAHGRLRESILLLG